jgi:hypothetical protein
MAVGKHFRRVQRKLDARVKACVAARIIVANREPKLRGVIEKAQKMPGSKRLEQ